MKKIPSHLFLFLLPALLLFNWLWKIIYDLANQQAPNSANIPSGSFHQLWQYVLENKNQYIITVLIYVFALWLFSLVIQGTFKYLARVLNHSKLAMRPFSLSIMLMVLLNAIAIFPFSMLGYRLPLTNLIKLPDFITQVLFEKSLIGIAVTIGLGLFCLVLLKSSQTIINLMQKEPLFLAIKHSWSAITGKTLWYLLLQFMLNLFTLLILSAVIYGLQTLIDTSTGPIVRIGANCLIIVFNAGIYLLSSWLLWQIVMVTIFNLPLSSLRLQKINFRFILATLGIGLIIGITSSTFNNNWFQSITNYPLVISHRGSNGNNGAPNSIASLKKTIRSAHPDYIEMDVQFTKDNQFIVLHDTNLKSLTGVDKTAKELTLKQITALKMHIDGHTANVPSFKSYLDYANKHHQKLLVELKTSLVANPKLLQAFINQFGTALVQNKALIHSLNKNLLKNLKQQDQKLKVGFILPYNTETLPKSNNAFYTVEYTTLTPNLVQEIHKQKREIFTWTANDTASMRWLSVMNVNAIITDYPSRLESILKEQKKHPKYAVPLLRYLLTVRQTF